MKIFTPFLIFCSFVSFGQNSGLAGHVKDREDGSNFSGLELLLLKGDSLITGTVSDKEGNFEILNLHPGTYDLIMQNIGYRVRTINNVILTPSNITQLNIIHPDSCITSNRICPKGHKDKIVPIKYGFAGKKMIRRAESGKIRLGGCVITYCDPKWYCKMHELEF